MTYGPFNRTCGLLKFRPMLNTTILNNIVNWSKDAYNELNYDAQFNYKMKEIMIATRERFESLLMIKIRFLVNLILIKIEKIAVEKLWNP